MAVCFRLLAAAPSACVCARACTEGAVPRTDVAHRRSAHPRPHAPAHDRSGRSRRRRRLGLPLALRSISILLRACGSGVGSVKYPGPLTCAALRRCAGACPIRVNLPGISTMEPNGGPLRLWGRFRPFAEP